MMIQTPDESYLKVIQGNRSRPPLANDVSGGAHYSQALRGVIVLTDNFYHVAFNLVKVLYYCPSHTP